MGLMPALALADRTFYVKPTGSDLLGGESFVDAWQTMAYANANLPQPNTTNGNIIVYIEDKSTEWDAFPNPAQSPANGKRYRFIALRFAGVPRAQCMLPDAVFTGAKSGTLTDAEDLDHISVIGFTINGGVDFDSLATADSLSYCSVDGGIYVRGADDCAMLYNSIDCSDGIIKISHEEHVQTLRFYFGYNTVTNLGQSGNDDYFYIGGGTPPYSIAWDTVIERNRIFWDIPSSASQASALIQYTGHHTIFRHNYFDITNHQQSPVDYPVVRLRSGGYNTLMRGDTIINRGPSTGEVKLSQCCDGGLTGDRIKRLTLDSLYVFADYSDAVVFGSGIDSFTVQYCVFSTKGSNAMLFVAGTLPSGWNQSDVDGFAGSVRGYNVFDHNTLYSSGSYRGVVDWYDTERRWHTSARVVFTNNIVAGTAATVGTCNNGMPKGVFWPKSNSSEPGYFVGKLTSNNNLFYIQSRTSVLGDHSIGYDRSGAIVCSRPGDNSLWEIGDGSADWTEMVNDSLSVFGLPVFNNGAGGIGSAPGVGFVPALGTTSAARGIGTSGSDAGAVAFYGEPQILLSVNELDLTAGSTSFTIHNVGTGTLRVTLESTDTEMTVDDATHDIAAGTYATVNVSMGACENFAGYLIINSNDRDRPTLYLGVMTECGGSAPP